MIMLTQLGKCQRLMKLRTLLKLHGWQNIVAVCSRCLELQPQRLGCRLLTVWLAIPRGGWRWKSRVVVGLANRRRASADQDNVILAKKLQYLVDSYAFPTATLASPGISCRRVSVCLSVCLSVTSRFLLKRLNVGSCKKSTWAQGL